MTTRLQRLLLLLPSMFYVFILSRYLIEDIRILLAPGYGVEKTGHIIGSPIGGFSMIRAYGFIFLTLSLVVSAILINIKIRKWTYIGFCIFHVLLFFVYL